MCSSLNALSDRDWLEATASGEQPDREEEARLEVLGSTLDDLTETVAEALKFGAKDWQIDAAVMRGRRNHNERSV